MAYIGREPQIGNFQVCDAISVVNGQAAYTMQVNSVNVSPETANHMLVSLNGVLQAPGSSYTVSGSTITFASNLVTGDVINFIHILGSVLDLGVPSDSTVSLAKLTATGTKNSTTFLRGDNSFAVPSGGKIGQVVTTTKTDTWSQSTSGNTFYQPTGFSRTITPTATSSKILIMTTASFSGTKEYEFGGKILRQIGGSDAEILIGDAASSRARTFMSKRTNEAQDFANFNMTVLDSPSTTSEITYRVMGATESSTTLYLNRGANDSDNSGEWRAASSIVCMEVLA